MWQRLARGGEQACSQLSRLSKLRLNSGLGFRKTRQRISIRRIGGSKRLKSCLAFAKVFLSNPLWRGQRSCPDQALYTYMYSMWCDPFEVPLLSIRRRIRPLAYSIGCCHLDPHTQQILSKRQPQDMSEISTDIESLPQWNHSECSHDDISISLQSCARCLFDDLKRENQAGKPSAIRWARGQDETGQDGIDALLLLHQEYGDTGRLRLIRCDERTGSLRTLYPIEPNDATSDGFSIMEDCNHLSETLDLLVEITWLNKPQIVCSASHVWDPEDPQHRQLSVKMWNTVMEDPALCEEIEEPDTAT